MLYYLDSPFYETSKSIKDNQLKYKEQENYNIDDNSRMKLGKLRPDNFDDLILYYQGHKYFPSKPNITSIRPPIPDEMLVGVKPYYVEKTNNQMIDVSGNVIPINSIKPQSKINLSVFN